MDIIKKFNDWAEKTNGTVNVNTTISLNNANIDIKANGTTLEDAFESLNMIIKEDVESKSENKPDEPAPEPIKPVIKPIFNEPTVNTGKNYEDVFKNKQVLRIHNNNNNGTLNNGEKLVSFNGLTYVVKDI